MNLCSSCRAPMFWVVTVEGRKMPLDAAPVPDGNVWVDGIGTAHVGEPPAGYLRYKSHFATCPNAKRHRKAR